MSSFPAGRVGGDDVGHQVHALLVVEHRYPDPDPVLGEPVVSTAQGPRLPDHHPGVPNGRTGPLRYQRGDKGVTIVVPR